MATRATARSNELALRFAVLGVPIEIQGSFLVLMGSLGLLTHFDPVLALGFVAIALVAVLAHEAGHAVAFRAFGDRPSIVLHGGGGVTKASDPGLARLVVVTAAGPATGIALGVLVALVRRVASPDIAASPLVDDALFLTIGLSLLNLVPMGAFDGATILNGLVTLAIGRPAGAGGWIVGALVVLAVVVGALFLGRIEIAIFVVVFVIINTSGATSIGGLFGTQLGETTPTGLISLGRGDEALAQAELASRRNPGDREAVLAYGSALLLMTRFAEAEVIFGGLLERDEDSLPARTGRFTARRFLGKREEAAADLEILLARPAVGLEEVHAQFQGLYRDGRYERALDLVRTELARPRLPRSDVVHLRMLESALESVAGYPQAALQHADALLSTSPDSLGAQEVTAMALLQLGRVEEAVVRAKRAVAGAPRHPELVETLGIAHRLAGRPDQALPLLVAAAAARPELPRARAEVSACFTQLGRHAEAAAALDSLPAWAADDANVLYARACILAAAGGLPEATEHVARAAAGRPALGWIARVDPILRPLGLAEP